MPFDGADFHDWPPPRPSPHPLRTLVVDIMIVALVPLLLLTALIQTSGPHHQRSAPAANMMGMPSRHAAGRPRTGQLPKVSVSPPLSLAPCMIHEDRRLSAVDGYTAFWVSVLQQALFDASWDGPEDIEPCAGAGRDLPRYRCAARATAWWDSILFFAGAFLPGYRSVPDPHPLALTLETICELLGWDVGRVRRHVLGMLRTRSAAHARLVAEAEVLA